MDTAMRDLERIREHDHEGERARQWGVWGLLALTTIALVVALGMMIGGSDPSDAKANDPLAALDGLAPEPPDTAAAKDPDVDPEKLSFPTALTEDRPEVTAAVAAAKAELEHPEPVGSAATPPRHDDPAGDPIPRTLPAAAAAAPSAPVLARTMLDDPLMAAAEKENGRESVDASPAKDPVGPGHEGKYTLQVISYHTPDEAKLFAETLRQRGHHAFVVSADLGDRGRFWRVRIGPFDSMHEAEAYRADFEKSEGMNTYVVRNDR